MRMLIIGPAEQSAIDRMVVDARRDYLPWAVLQHGAILNEKNTLDLDERKPGFERPPSQHIELGSYTVAFSFEEQPAGIFRHLSMSVPTPGKLPHIAAVEMVCQAFHFEQFPPKEGSIWLEEFAPGHHAVNVVELAEPTAIGNA